MRRFALLAVGTLCGAAASSQSLVDCINPDVLHGLLLQGEFGTTFTATTPRELATFKVPAGLTWVGNAERRNSLSPLPGRQPMYIQMATAAYRSSLPPDAARTATQGALVAAGWKLTPRESPISMASAFTLDSELSYEARYCLDGNSANVNTRAVDGVNYVLVLITREGTANAGGYSNGCDAPPPRPASGMSIAVTNTLSPLAQYLPKLDAPLDPATGRQVVMAFGSGGSIGMPTHESMVRFTVKDSAVNVARHFARQMAQQGWTADASWGGATTAGSTWSRDAAADTVHATLSIALLGDDQFAASIRVFKAK